MHVMGYIPSLTNRSISIRLAVIASETPEMSQDHRRSSILVSMESPLCDFLVPISH